MAALLGAGCGEQPDEGSTVLQSTPGERVPCVEAPAEPWALVVLGGPEPGCGIGFGADRLAEVLAQVPDATEDDVVDIEDDPTNGPAKSVIVVTRRTDSMWRFAWATSTTECDPQAIEIPEDCEGCEIECAEAIDDCEGSAGCCEPPSDCAEDNPCCPGQVCVEGPSLLLEDVREATCVDACTSDAECGERDCCVPVGDTATLACQRC